MFAISRFGDENSFTCLGKRCFGMAAPWAKRDELSPGAIRSCAGSISFVLAIGVFRRTPAHETVFVPGILTGIRQAGTDKIGRVF